MSIAAPCTPYVSHERLASCCDIGLDDEDDTLVSRQIASSFLFYMLGQQFPGLCEQYIRPVWSCSPCGGGNAGYGLRHNGRTCGCSDRPTVSLSRWNVSSVDEVWLNGEVLDPAYYNVIDHNKAIVFREDSGLPLNCQEWSNPAFPDLDEDGPYLNTWGIKLTTGIEAPEPVIQAAAELACHYRQMCSGECVACDTGVGFLGGEKPFAYGFNAVLPHVYTGINTVDWVIRTFNKNGSYKVKASVWSPEADDVVTEY